MAAVGSPTPVSDDLVRTHMQGWLAFTQFVKIGTGGVIGLLVLMAIFLL
ncbi:aa3-type cytochrome c oxidase subunit IV [Azospirillum cavernae]|nr:aa3-type cytochrome c oxidase subunit IV [Azospirillum cavernae]